MRGARHLAVRPAQLQHSPGTTGSRVSGVHPALPVPLVQRRCIAWPPGGRRLLLEDTLTAFVSAQAQQGIGISGVASGWAAGPSTDSEDDPDAQPQTGEQALHLQGLNMPAYRA